MSKLVIEWSNDEYDCEDCGLSSSTGAVATLDGEVIVNIPALAHCYDGNGDADITGILLIALEKLGVTIEENMSSDLEWYKGTCREMDHDGNFIEV